MERGSNTTKNGLFALNPVESGFVLEPHFWKYSSAIDYSGGKGLI